MGETRARQPPSQAWGAHWWGCWEVDSKFLPRLIRGSWWTEPEPGLLGRLSRAACKHQTKRIAAPTSHESAGVESGPW